MKLAIKDHEGNVYTNNMNDKRVILEIHFCTSYTQAVVQEEVVDEEGNSKFMTKDIIIPNKENEGTLESSLDFIAVNEDELGSWE